MESENPTYECKTVANRNCFAEIAEQRFSKAERKFADEVLTPYHETGQTVFKYEGWLSYFICSVNWRTLHLDNVGFHSDEKWGKEVLGILDSAERTLADFLLDKRGDIGSLENHILPMFEITGSNADLGEPNFLFRISAFDYTFFVPPQNAYYVCANLAGVLIFTIISKGQNDIWDNTIVNTGGGTINQPPVRISSPLIPDMVKLLIRSIAADMSQKQIDKIIQTFEKNPDAGDAKAAQYRRMDNP